MWNYHQNLSKKRKEKNTSFYTNVGMFVCWEGKEDKILEGSGMDNIHKIYQVKVPNIKMGLWRDQ